MSQSRRDFIRHSSLAATGALLFPSLLKASPAFKELVGVQLYSIREDMKKDPLGSLKALAKMGYRHVEHANYVNRKFYGWTPAEFKKILADLGMSMPSGHTVLGKAHWDESRKDFTDVWKYTVEDAAYMGQQYVISPWLDESWRSSEDVLKKYMDVFNKAGELCKKNGMRFGYHNHDFEFTQKFNGKTVYDLILDLTEQDLVIHQLDIGNMYNGGAKALEVMQRHPNRFQSMHVKDEIASSGGHDKYESTILGTGIVPVKEAIDLGRKSGGTHHFIIEQESYQGKTPMACVEEDLKIMKKWGYGSVA